MGTPGNDVDGPCSSTEYGAMPGWDVSAVTDMTNAFQGKSDFNANISGWDTSSVTNMFQMFREVTAFNQPIGDRDTSSVTNMVGRCGLTL
jgi:surface protein